MAWQKGMEKTGGRQKGTKNKSTEKARELFQSIMDGQQKRIKEALDKIYKDDPQKYLYVLNKYFPYYMPKQEQIDISIENNELPFSIEIQHREKDSDSE